jgi:phenylalanyl-tRNA synthetase beta subunit
LRFRDATRTLTEADVTPLLDAVIGRLAAAHGVRLRAT